MKLITKIGVISIVFGAVLTAAGGIVCMATPEKEFVAFYGDPISYEKKIDGDFTELEVEAAFMNIEIRQGDEFMVVADNVPEKLDLDVTKSGSKLKIKRTEEFRFFDFKFGGINGDSVGTYTIYVPENTLKKLDIDIAFSSMEISSVNAEKLDIDCAFGEYNINGSVYGKIDMDSSYSDTSLNNVECDKIDCSDSFGNLSADALMIRESGDFSVSFGDIDVRLSGDNYRFSCENAFGSAKTFNCPEETVDIEVNVDFGDAVFEN